MYAGYVLGYRTGHKQDKRDIEEKEEKKMRTHIHYDFSVSSPIDVNHIHSESLCGKLYARGWNRRAVRKYMLRQRNMCKICKNKYLQLTPIIPD